MGFIERLKREEESRRLREKAREEAEKQKAVQEEEEQSHRRELANAQRNLIEDSWKKSSDYYSKSFFPGFLNTLTQVGRGQRRPTVMRQDGSILIEVLLSSDCKRTKLIDSDYEYTYEDKFIEVVTCPNGTLLLNGGIRGNSTLDLNTMSNSDVQEKALEKAFNHPKSRIRRDRVRWVHHPGGGGQG